MLELPVASTGAWRHTNLMTDTDAINALRTTYFAAYDSGDVAAIADLVGPETVLNTPTGSVSGRDAILAHYGRTFAAMQAVFEDQLDEVEVCGDMAFTRGCYRLTLLPRSGAGEPVARAGRYLVILKRNADSIFGWTIHREVVQTLSLDQVPSRR
jgi:uncharacterized protein (TIGR02246 family)